MRSNDCECWQKGILKPKRGQKEQERERESDREKKKPKQKAKNERQVQIDANLIRQRQAKGYKDMRISCKNCYAL